MGDVTHVNDTLSFSLAVLHQYMEITTQVLLTGNIVMSLLEAPYLIEAPSQKSLHIVTEQ